jgi:signal transduction histidine kinase
MNDQPQMHLDAPCPPTASSASGASGRPCLKSFDDEYHAIICRARVFLAAGALVALLIDPPNFTPSHLWLNLLLAANLFYSLMLCLQNGALIGFCKRAAVALDAVWYLLLIGMTGGVTSPLFLLLLFPITAVAFRKGYPPAWKMSLGLACSFIAVAVLAPPQVFAIELNMALLRPAYLLVLGQLVAYLGGAQYETRRKLQLLNDLSTIANPRFGAGQTLANATERLRDFYHAHHCLLLHNELELVAIANRTRATVQRPPDALASLLLSLPQDQFVFYADGKVVVPPDACPGLVETCAGIADLLEETSFASTPIAWRAPVRVYIAPASQAIGGAARPFLHQAVEHLLQVVENVRLVDQLASQALASERRRISRDIHDNTIQPYIALQLGLRALILKQPAGSQIVSDLDQLIRLTEQGIAELRRYTVQLKNSRDSGNVLATAIRRQIEELQVRLDVETTVEVADDLQLNDRLAAEILQMITEGLSNVRRHAATRSAHVRLQTSDAGWLELTIANPRSTGETADFLPRSLSERAEALGGLVEVGTAANDDIAVIIKIPL